MLPGSPYATDGIWMREYPKGYLIPLGTGQRSDPEANRLVDWLLTNGIIVEELKQAETFDGKTYGKGSYVVWMTQAHRGLADTALSVGDGHLEPDRAALRPARGVEPWLSVGRGHDGHPPRLHVRPVTNRVTKSSHLLGGVEPGAADAYVLGGRLANGGAGPERRAGRWDAGRAGDGAVLERPG